jgi:zinc protease
MKKWFVLVVALGISAIVHAGPTYQVHRLNNGLEVSVAENHSLPLVAVEVAVKNGSTTESTEYNGVSHLWEHMFFQGNAVIPSGTAFNARLKELGASANATIGEEAVTYYLTASSDQLGSLMTLMRDSLLTPRYKPDELGRDTPPPAAP